MSARLAMWMSRVAAAALAGGAWRFLRRLARRPPRIWHGFTPLHATAWMVQAERRAGFPSLSVVTNTRATRYALVRSEDFDVVFEERSSRWDDVHWHTLEHLLLHADVWNAYFDCLVFNPNDVRKNELAFRLIRAMGIRIVVQLHGSDLLCTGKVKTRYGWPERAQLDYPLWDLEEQRGIVETRVALFTRYAHFIIAGDSIFKPFLQRWDVSFHTVPVDVDSLQPSNPREPPGPPVIIHAPNHRHVKATDALLAACDELRARGFAFELRLIESVPRHQALDLYRDAAIIADQFTMGGFGIFALEGMALAKPVLTYLDEEHHTNPVFSHPLVNTTPENLRDVLAVLLSLPELRQRIGEAGRESVVRYQSFPVMGEVWARIYRHVWWGAPLDLSSTRHFDPARGTRALTEDPGKAAFWPVPVDDLIQRIAAALERVADQKTSSAGTIGSEP